jgi:hypothetical protein
MTTYEPPAHLLRATDQELRNIVAASLQTGRRNLVAVRNKIDRYCEAKAEEIIPQLAKSRVAFERFDNRRQVILAIILIEDVAELPPGDGAFAVVILALRRWMKSRNDSVNDPNGRSSSIALQDNVGDDISLPNKRRSLDLQKLEAALATTSEATAEELREAMQRATFPPHVRRTMISALLIADSPQPTTLAQFETAKRRQFAALSEMEVFQGLEPSITGLNKYLKRLHKETMSSERKREVCRIVNFWKGELKAVLLFTALGKRHRPQIVNLSILGSKRGQGGFQLKTPGPEKTSVYSASVFPFLQAKKSR